MDTTKAKPTESETKVSIEIAKAEDAEEIVRIHYASVHEICARDYKPNHLNAWSSEPNEKRFAFQRERLTNGERTYWVARVNGEAVGFSSADFREEKIGTLYLRPDWIGRGVGELLLAKAEEALRKHGLKRIKLIATLNAENFYKRHGYNTRGYIDVPFNGEVIPSVEMEKNA